MKKNFILLVSAVLFSLIVSAGNAPEAVANAFRQKFPAITKVTWAEEKDKGWEGEFKMNGVEMSANFSMTGEWLETETEIHVSGLPLAVINAFKKLYPGAKITEASKIEKPGDVLLYETELTKDKKKIDLIFDKDGIQVK
jgi:hypothetical protein